MRTRAKHAATTPSPVPRSAPEFHACIFPHLSRPTRGPKGTWGDHHVVTLSLGVRETGRQWQSRPVPTAPRGKPAIHDTTVDKVLAKGADEGHTHEAKHWQRPQTRWIPVVDVNLLAVFARLSVFFSRPWRPDVRWWHKRVAESGAARVRTERWPASTSQPTLGNAVRVSAGSVPVCASTTASPVSVDTAHNSTK